jgi:hypothetical protein
VTEKELLKAVSSLWKDGEKTIKKKGTIPAVFFVFGSKGNAVAPVGHIKYKELWKLALNEAVKEVDGYAAFMLSEAWVSMPKNEEEEKRLKLMEISPSQDPNRKECLIAYGKSCSGAKVLVMRPFTKDSCNNVTWLEEVRFLGSEDEKKCESRFFDDLWNNVQ